MIYSNSAFDYFQQCKLKYKFKYIDKEEKYFSSVETFLGSRVHDSLEKLYRDLKYEKFPSLEELLEFYNSIWDKHWNENIRVVRKEYLPENYKKMGIKYLEDYYNSYEPFNQDKTLDLECWVRFTLDEDLEIIGKIDRLAKLDEGTYVIHDYKTSQKLPTQEDIDSDRQLALYHIGVLDKWPNIKEIKFLYHFVAFNEEIESLRTSDQLEETKKEVIELIKEIQDTKDFPPTETALCEWCEFQPICPRRKHFFLLETLPSEEYRQDDGVKLVNEYTKIWHEGKELEAKLKDIKDRICHYAIENNLRAMKGSDHRIYVKTGKELRFPKKEEEKYEDLKNLLVEIGKYEETSSINPWQLKKIVESAEWGIDITKKLTKLGSIVENRWVSQPYQLKGN